MGRDLKSARASSHQALAKALWLSLALGLGGCASTVADLPLVGLPADAPSRKDSHGYIPVHDIPMARDTAVLAPADQAKLQSELIAARDRQAAAAAAAK